MISHPSFNDSLSIRFLYFFFYDNLLICACKYLNTFLEIVDYFLPLIEYNDLYLNFDINKIMMLFKLTKLNYAHRKLYKIYLFDNKTSCYLLVNVLKYLIKYYQIYI